MRSYRALIVDGLWLVGIRFPSTALMVDKRYRGQSAQLGSERGVYTDTDPGTPYAERYPASLRPVCEATLLPARGNSTVWG